MDPIFIWLGGVVVLIIVGVKMLERLGKEPVPTQAEFIAQLDLVVAAGA